MTIRAPFQPRRGTNQIVTTGGTSASVTIDATAKSVRFVNSGATNLCYVRVGKGAQTATNADTPVLPGQALILQKGDGDDTVAYLQETGSTTLHIQTGEGGQ